ncbi:ribosome silencing factor [Fontimonas sp. SYSU GA230001]|uniref:ribosome silencing factor n=1 Tax=Fontimonas sp. SYSU GA230001 TaxID=3142450 RepID=UPI0032B58B9A
MRPHTKHPKLSRLAKIAVDALEDLKGQDIRVLDVQKLTTVTDTMIICTGTSNRHVKSLAQNVWQEAKQAGYAPMGIEGEEAGEWVLVDLGGVVVHVMQAQARAHYQLEKLWTVDEALPVVESKPRKTAAKKAAKKADKKAAQKTAKPAGKKSAAKKSAVAKAPRKTAARSRTQAKR